MGDHGDKVITDLQRQPVSPGDNLADHRIKEVIAATAGTKLLPGFGMQLPYMWQLFPERIVHHRVGAAFSICKAGPTSKT